MGPSSCIEITLGSAEADLELLSQSYLNNRAYVHASQNVTSVVMSKCTKNLVSYYSRLGTRIVISQL